MCLSIDEKATTVKTLLLKISLLLYKLERKKLSSVTQCFSLKNKNSEFIIMSAKY